MPDADKPAEPVDTTNDYAVGADGRGPVVMLHVHGPVPKAKALRLAAYLVLLADPEGTAFPAVLEAVSNA